MQETAATPSMERIRSQRSEQGPVFWIEKDILAVFDARAAQRLDAANFADLTLQDGLSDTLLGRSSEPVTWNQLRSAWSTRMRALTSPAGLRDLATRMNILLDNEAGKHQDLVWLSERLTINSLIPAIIGGLKSSAYRRIFREVLSKVAFVFSDVEPPRSRRRQQWAMVFHQLLAGWEVRRELLGRQRGSRPRQQDLTDPVVDMLPQLGIGRAVDVVTSLLTAITGSPGAAASCLLFELSRRQDWYSRIEAELQEISVDELYESPVRAAPLTARFVKEVLRIWASPSVVIRNVRVDIEIENISLKTGQRYVLSPLLVHHDETYWQDPGQFDPDRWTADSARGDCPQGAYVPFGWAPKSCVGANLGLAQLILLAHLVCTQYRIQTPADSRASIILASVVRPKDFLGTIQKRS